MDLSAIIHGRYATASQCGSLLAAGIDNKIRIHFARDPERCLELKTAVLTKDLAGLRWSADSGHVAVISPKLIEVLDLEDPSRRVRIDNGSGSLGSFTGAEFVGNSMLLTFWEFGQVKSWDREFGRETELHNIKTSCDGPAWHVRPTPSTATSGLSQPHVLAMLARPGADDHLNILSFSDQTPTPSIKLATSDAQSLSWSPDGRWLAVRDTPTASTSIFIYTPDGHLFRRFPTKTTLDLPELGIKSMTWSGDARILALCGFDGKVICLNTKTFTPVATVEHTTTIDPRGLSMSKQVLIWQETISASKLRTFSPVTHPISPPLSRSRPTTTPDELGVAECRGDRRGAYLATRDERMLNTVWIWNLAELRLQTVLLLHNPIRRVHWHPSRASLLLLDGTDGVTYIFDTAADGPPTSVIVDLGRSPTTTWLSTDKDAAPIALARAKTAFRLVYPAGRDLESESKGFGNHFGDQVFDEGASEDSIFDMLSGRKPMPAKTEPSYTERIDFEAAEADEDLTERLDDTFHGKRAPGGGEHPPEIDPLDDSQIF